MSLPEWIERPVFPLIQAALDRGKSILLLGPRQVGKTSLLRKFDFDLEISLLLQKERLRFEKNPDSLVHEVESTARRGMPLIFIDEVQKVPALLDVIQYLTDRKLARFLLTGSSARKFQQESAVNLLPGRVARFRLDPLTIEEWRPRTIEALLLNGSLPPIALGGDALSKEADLDSYVGTFLDEEIRKEAAVRNIPAFARFLELAAIDSGRISNFSEISKQIGVAHTTIASHYQVLCDCLVTERFDPITKSASRKKLTRSSKYVFFDLGVRRLAGGEGSNLNPERMGELFEQWVGLELRRLLRLHPTPGSDVLFWRDPDGPEVDWVLQLGEEWVPIEVKWSDRPKVADSRHLQVFMDEYRKKCRRAVVVCRTPRRLRLAHGIEAISWSDLPELLKIAG